MRVVDAYFLVDLLDDDPDAIAYLEEHEDVVDSWLVAAANYAEVLVGEGNYPGGDVYQTHDALDFLDVVDVDETTALLAGQIAQEIGDEGPFLDGSDAIAAAIGRQHDAPVVSGDSDLTHPETQKVVDVETY